MKDRYLLLCATLARWRSSLADATNDRGEINSSVAWTGAMLLIAVGAAAVLSGKSKAFVDNIDFGP